MARNYGVLHTKKSIGLYDPQIDPLSWNVGSKPVEGLQFTVEEGADGSWPVHTWGIQIEK
jgi:hypothetical protein